MVSARSRELILLMLVVTTTFWWALALFSPSYHYQQLYMFDIISIFADLSLWTFNAKSDCLPYFGQWPGYSTKRPSFDEKLCHQMLKLLDGKEIDDAVQLVCEVQASMFNLADVGCVKLSNLVIASRILSSCIAITLLWNTVVIVSALIFFHMRPTLRLKAVIQVFSAAALMTCLFGFVAYIMLGGQLDQRSFGGILTAVTNGKDTSSWSYSTGFAVATGCCICQMVSTVLGIIIIPSNICYDYNKEDDEDELKAQKTPLMPTRAGDPWNTGYYPYQAYY